MLRGHGEPHLTDTVNYNSLIDVFGGQLRYQQGDAHTRLIIRR
jgi:hypothetical protein